MVQAGKIDCIIVKDLSQSGRNSIETGYFIERVFPLCHTRFISVSDDFDTANFKGDTGGIDGCSQHPDFSAYIMQGRDCPDSCLWRLYQTVHTAWQQLVKQETRRLWTAGSSQVFFGGF